MRHIILSLLLFFVSASALTAQSDLRIALLKYRGGGDWYANPTSLPNLVKFANAQLKTAISEDIATVEPDSPELFYFPVCPHDRVMAMWCSMPVKPTTCVNT